MVSALSELFPTGKSIMTLANKITLLRIILIPVIVIGLLKNPYSKWILALMGFSMLTDLLDGLVARARGERTPLGAFLDPMADKLLLAAVFLTLTYKGLIDVWLFVVVFSRDLLIVLGWAIIYILTGSSNIVPRPLGKMTTTVQMATALAVIIPFYLAGQKILIWTTVAFTVASAVDYIVMGEKRLGEWR